MDQYNYKYGNGYLDEKKKTNVPLLNWYANTVKEILLSWHGRFVGKKERKSLENCPLCLFWTNWQDSNHITIEGLEHHFNLLKPLLFKPCSFGAIHSWMSVPYPCSIPQVMGNSLVFDALWVYFSHFLASFVYPIDKGCALFFIGIFPINFSLPIKN